MNTLRRLPLLALASWVTLVAADERIAWWRQPRAAVVRDTVFISGGDLYTYSWDPSISNWTQSNDISIIPEQSPLTGSGIIYSLSLNRTLSVYDDFFKIFGNWTLGPGTTNPGFRDGFMFADDYEFYTFGGLALDATGRDADLLNDEIWKPEGDTPTVITLFQAGLNTHYQIPSNYDVDKYVTHGAGVNIPDQYLGFYFSGLQSPSGGFIMDSSPDYEANTTVNTMIQVNMTRMGDAQWEPIALNSSATPIGRAGASLSWLPFGLNGLLVVLGGATLPADALNNQSASSVPSDATFMTTVAIYDINTQTWYSQQTTGDSPPPVTAACAVVAHETSSNSYQIFVYGGYSGNLLDDPYNSVWILSVPSFRWTQITPSNADGGRYGHFCTTPYPDQMLVIGGAGTFGFQPLPDGKMIQLLNLTSLEWKDEYNPSVWAEYYIPSIIKNQGDLGQTPANMDGDLSALFQQPYTTPPTVWYPYTSSTGGANKWLAPVLGGVLGGVAVALAGFLILFFCRRKRRRSESQPATSETQRPTTNEGVDQWRRQVKSLASSGILEIDSSDRSTVNNEPQAPVEIAGPVYLHPLLSPGSPRSPGSPGSPGISAVPPHSPQSGSVEISGDPSFRQELQGTSLQDTSRHQPPMTEQPDYRFRNHPLFPLNVNETMSVSESAYTTGHGQVSSVGVDPANDTILSHRAAPLGMDDYSHILWGRPPSLPPKQPISPEPTNLHHQPSAGRLPYEDIYPGDPLPSPVVKELPTSTLPSSHASRAFQISPLEMGMQSPVTGIVGPEPSASIIQVANDPTSALPNQSIIHQTRSRPQHHRNASSQSSGMKITGQTLPPSPDAAEDNRRSELIEAMPEDPSGQAAAWPQHSGNSRGGISIVPPSPNTGRVKRKVVGSPTSPTQRTAYEETNKRFGGGDKMR